MSQRLNLITALLLITLSSATDAAPSALDRCLLGQLKNADPERSVAQIRASCAHLEPEHESLLNQRVQRERASAWNRYMITAHRQNYILPYTYTSEINVDAYEFAGDWQDQLEREEAKFQLSMKVRLNQDDLLQRDDGLYFGVTLQSWWQVYNNRLSAPFRENNYQPEIYYTLPLRWQPFNGNTELALGLEHQSNGRSQALSRSWNRVFAELTFQNRNFALTLRPWYRIPEDEKENPGDSKGDDNPDIDKFMGHFELRTVYRWADYELSAMARNNLRSDNKGALEVGFSFPLNGPLKGYVQYFNGYGESLIDYDISQQRIGLGILLTDFL